MYKQESQKIKHFTTCNKVRRQLLDFIIKRVEPIWVKGIKNRGRPKKILVNFRLCEFEIWITQWQI